MKYLQYFNESKKSKPNYQELSIGDFKVYRGRDAEANEFVTFQIADDNDLWFHAKGVPGSHLVIKVDDKLVTPEVIKQAAEIVAKNSKTDKKEIEVIYCQKKFVKKQSGSALGKVSVDYPNTQQITIFKN